MCDRVLERIELLESEVTDMTEGWRGVEEGGKSLKDACERLLIEKVNFFSPHGVEVGSHLPSLLQDRLVEMTEAIGQHLQYFQELESATRMLNHPGESLVLQVDFLYMVERVDLCIEYFKQHVRSFSLEFTHSLTSAPTEKF